MQICGADGCCKPLSKDQIHWKNTFCSHACRANTLNRVPPEQRLAKKKATQKAWLARNREHMRAYLRAWKEKNRERVNRLAREWRRANWARVREQERDRERITAFPQRKLPPVKISFIMEARLTIVSKKWQPSDWWKDEAQDRILEELEKEAA